MKIFIIISLSLLTISCNNNPKLNGSFNLGKQEQKYGDANITSEGVISGTELMALLEKQDSVQVKVTGTINAVCQKKGCWMYIDLDESNEMLVKFMDYGFFMPLNASGSTAIVEGVAKVDTLSVAWLQHQLEDANANQEEIDAITEPKISYSIQEATGVILK